jgi:hypothetical protein
MPKAAPPDRPERLRPRLRRHKIEPDDPREDQRDAGEPDGIGGIVKPIFNSCGGFSGDRPLILQAFSR